MKVKAANPLLRVLEQFQLYVASTVTAQVKLIHNFHYYSLQSDIISLAEQLIDRLVGVPNVITKVTQRDRT